MPERPIVGIATQTLDPIPGELPLAWVMGQKYVRVLCAAGAVPWVIPLLEGDAETLRHIYAQLDGIFLTGGVDVDPQEYKAPKVSVCGRTDPPRDWTEMNLVRWAAAEGKPVLGVCRGMQVINVAMGGTLYQDIAQEHKDQIKHDHFPAPENEYRRDLLVHDVKVSPNTRLAGILGAEGTSVNSMHHQAVRELGAGLKATAVAPDELIEGIEGKNGQFLIGVQWHPEELTETHAGMRRLFEAFVQASREYRLRSQP